MKYVLILITLNSGTPDLAKVNDFQSMEECFDAREVVVEGIGRPIINYQALCLVQSDQKFKKRETWF